MTLDKENHIIRCEYPFNGKELLQVSNYGQALTVQKSVERQLYKEGLTEAYNEEIKKAIKRGAIKRIEDEEIAEHQDSPQHYITHFPVVNPGSRTTKCVKLCNEKHSHKTFIK